MPEDCNLKEQLQHCKDAARVDFKAHKKVGSCVCVSVCVCV